ncbi:hypothetical protein M3147_12740 [Agromyces mediolanus]|uniref:hypothetical protein n=1 Tax=Agromyces mediolanus TaxID=41986 RepID=UPI00203FBA33|nr:hypothetical protein [Agromyces mediolanus]MCM3658116.1 hypothetical protein [Agromyces mediolanus]
MGIRRRRAAAPPTNPEDDPYLAYLIWKGEQPAAESEPETPPKRGWWQRMLGRRDADGGSRHES